MTVEETSARLATTSVEMTTIADVIDRYQQPGPHASVIMQMPTPGQAGNDPTTRWHARRTELRHSGAEEAALAWLDQAADSIEPRGAVVLLTANARGAAHCWLLDHAPTPMTCVGDDPALLAALDELRGRAPVIAAAVDHLGADLYRIDHIHTADIGTVEGEDVQDLGHRREDQAGQQRRAQAVYDRNAAAIASALNHHASAAESRLVVLTGDDREVGSVIEHLDMHRLTARAVQAGARHKATVRRRLGDSAREEASVQRAHDRNEAISRLRRELGQQALGVEGNDTTARAISEGRVDTLFIDRGVPVDEADRLARQALLFGGDVVVADELDVTDGVAAVLRYAAT